MKTKSLALFAIGAGCALLITTTSVRSQDGETAEASAMAAMAPGPMHAHLTPLAGEWTVAGKWRMEPKGEWVPFEGQATRELVMGGRHLIENFSSELMGRAFEAQSITGYDNLRKEYTSVWFDNMSTGTMISTGSANDDGTQIIFTGEHSDTTTGATHKWFKVRYTTADADHNSFESFTKSSPEGEEWRSMVLEYSRK